MAIRLFLKHKIACWVVICKAETCPLAVMGVCLAAVELSSSESLVFTQVQSPASLINTLNTSLLLFILASPATKAKPFSASELAAHIALHVRQSSAHVHEPRCTRAKPTSALVMLKHYPNHTRAWTL